jgi:hypothetical protein
VCIVGVAASLANAAGCAGKKRPFADGTDGAYVDPNLAGGDGEQEEASSALPDPDTADDALDEQSSAAGEVVIGPRLAVDPFELELGSIVLDLAAVRAVVVSNTGDRPLAAPTVSLLAGSAPEFTVLQNGCQDAIDPGESCALQTQFLPTTSGDFAGTMLVDAAEAGSARVALTGRGLPPGNLIVSPVEGESAQFGSVQLGQSADTAFTVVNTGDVSSGPLSITLNNPSFAMLEPTGTDCVSGVTDLGVGESCTLRVAFTPSRREPSDPPIVAN